MKHSVIYLAALLAACGGGGAPSSQPEVVYVKAAPPDGSVQVPPSGLVLGAGTSAPVTANPGLVPVPPPPTAIPAVETAPSQEPSYPWPRGPDAPPTGRTLTWWGASPFNMDQSNFYCTPQPLCRIPDGDLNVWNGNCSPQATCRYKLSTDEPPAQAFATQSTGTLNLEKR